MSDHTECVFEQYWLHARHQELQFLTFTGIYGAIIVGAFAYMGSQFSGPQSRAFLGVAVSVLSFLAFCLAYNFEFAFTKFSRLAEKIKSDFFGLQEYKPFDIGVNKGFDGYVILHLFFGIMMELFSAVCLWTLTEAGSVLYTSNLCLRETLIGLDLFLTALLLTAIWLLMRGKLNELKEKIEPTQSSKSTKPAQK